jgi:FkbH-like protein
VANPNTCVVGLLSDFNTLNLAACLAKVAVGSRSVKCVHGPVGDPRVVLLDSDAEFWKGPLDGLVVWMQPQYAVPTFQKALRHQEFDVEQLLTEVDDFTTMLVNIPQGVRHIVVPSWVAPDSNRGLGPLDLMSNAGVTNALMRMNLRLAERCQAERRLTVLDAQRWLNAGGASAYHPRLWYMSKTPFHNRVFQEAAEDVASALRGLSGGSKKLVILDLDNTLWGGVVGDDGLEGLRLGGHDAVGEAFVDFQRALQRLANRGVLLAVVSKNEEAVALKAISTHPEMVLRLSDFASWRINWGDKAQNIVELVAQLNLGLDAAVFLDDSPFERARVREALPEVLVPDLPADPMLYPSFVGALRCFDTAFVGAEDRERSAMYKAERERTAARATAGSLDEWLALLDLRVTAEPLNQGNLERATQLFNKTNQMNLSTRRLTSTELLDWSKADGRMVWTFRVADRFGEYGLCGLISLVLEGKRGRLFDFILSCRVMGRGVEDVMLQTAAKHAAETGCSEIYAELIPTPKNHPCHKWLSRHPELTKQGHVFKLPLQPAGAAVGVKMDDGSETLEQVRHS